MLWRICLVFAGCALLAPSPQAATVSACREPVADSAATAQQVYDANGRLISLAVTETAPAGDCVVLALPVAASDVRWLALHELPVIATPRRFVLQGLFDTDAVVISEVIHDQPVQTETGLLPLGDDIRPQFTHFAFGVEERAVLTESGELSCAAGTQTAGVVLQTASRWPPLAGMSLEVTVSGSGRFELAIADAAQQLAGTSEPLGIIDLQSSLSPQVVKLRLPEGATSWSGLTLLCPQQEANLKLITVKLLPAEAAAMTSARAAWLWSPELWLNRQAAIWTLAAQERLRRIYITVPVAADGRVAESGRLARFLREARRRGIAV